MASSGTVYVVDSMKGRKGNVIVVGRLKLGNDAKLEAQSFALRRIMGIAITPQMGDRFGPIVPGSIGSQSTKRYDRSWVTVNGSLGSGGSLNNYVRTRTFFNQTFGSITMKSAANQGTKGIYIGTKAGSLSASFIAWGN